MIILRHIYYGCSTDGMRHRRPTACGQRVRALSAVKFTREWQFKLANCLRRQKVHERVDEICWKTFWVVIHLIFVKFQGTDRLAYSTQPPSGQWWNCFRNEHRLWKDVLQEWLTPQPKVFNLKESGNIWAVGPKPTESRPYAFKNKICLTTVRLFRLPLLYLLLSQQEKQTLNNKSV
jgi:hypothetical protein